MYLSEYSMFFLKEWDKKKSPSIGRSLTFVWKISRVVEFIIHK